MTFGEAIAARTIYAECRNEPLEGQFAVANVIWNRLNSGRWGKTLGQVCLAPVQFSCWLSKDPQRDLIAGLRDDDPALLRCLSVLHMARLVPDRAIRPEYQATHYHGSYMNPFPGWALQGKRLGQIGLHIFYNEVP